MPPGPIRRRYLPFGRAPLSPGAVKPTDEERMLAVAGGDHEAFRELVLAHEHAAWSVAYRFLRDAAEAEDAAQEAFLRIFQAASRYRPTASFRTYLYRVVARICIDRAEKKHPVYTDTVPDVADPSPTPAEDLAAGERTDLVRRALDALPPKQRMAVILRYYEDLDYSGISRVLEVTVKAVEGLLGRARAALQVSLAPMRD